MPPNEVVINIISGAVEIMGDSQAEGFVIDLGGTPRPGQVWKIKVNGTTYDYQTESWVDLTFVGTPALSEIWTVKVDGVPYSVTISDTIDTLDEIAATLEQRHPTSRPFPAGRSFLLSMPPIVSSGSQAA